MAKEAYRIQSPVLGLYLENGPHRSVIPKGAVIYIDRDTFKGDRLVQVRWNGKMVMMFTQDLRSRGQRL
jgi:hypothetical protein